MKTNGQWRVVAAKRIYKAQIKLTFLGISFWRTVNTAENRHDAMLQAKQDIAWRRRAGKIVEYGTEKE